MEEELGQEESRLRREQDHSTHVQSRLLAVNAPQMTVCKPDLDYHD